MGIEEQVSDRPKTHGVIAGSFDLLHPGHILALSAAKDNCDHLTVLLQTDPTIDRPEKNKPIQSMLERYMQLEGCRYVDGIIPYDTEHDLFNVLSLPYWDVRFLDEKYKGTDFTGCNLKLKVLFIERQHDYSSSSLRKRIYNAELDSVVSSANSILDTKTERDFGR